MTGALEKLHEELGELEQELARSDVDSADVGPADVDLRDRIEDEVGDLLFAAVNVARLAGIHPSTALERAAGKFAARFRALLDLAADRDIDPDDSDLETLDRLWEEVKKGPRS